MSPDLWFKRSCSLSQKTDVALVAAVHGPGAVLVFEELLAMAKQAKAGGHVESAYAVLALRAWVKPTVARKIVKALAGESLVELDSDTRDSFAVTIPDWEQWNPTDPTNADRQRRYRERHRNALRNGSSNAPHNAEAVTDTVSVTDLEERRRDKRSSSPKPSGRTRTTPSQDEVDLADHVVGILERGIDSIPTDEGMKRPTRAAVLKAIEGHHPDRVMWAATATRSIAQSQGRAPNIVGLFAQQLAKEAA
jgi:hypothetical protein